MAEEQAVAVAATKEERSTGRVVRFSDKKGFGFIKPDVGDKDLFVHHSAIKSDGGYRTLYEDDVVEFTILLTEDKYQAIEVTAPGGGPIKRRTTTSGGFSRRNNNKNGVGCFNCGNPGHIARDCNNNSSKGYNNYNNSNNRGGDFGCYKCGSSGHFARECTKGNNNGCYSCGGFGHVARDCPGGSGACYNCGGYGHLARDCTSARVTGGGRFGGGNSGGCFNCGNEGHFARDCPEQS
ncbi:PREDICTED: cold shock protein 1-like [Populus euphratica]|uniref:Cold shock protein 1-like n=1 Tax=Populus euphratica TaxID=75702 RepID=A0AAJ6X832_POPEU|nr:PREDICTED: cold shock protein 1-like [Populus euphratica]